MEGINRELQAEMDSLVSGLSAVLTTARAARSKSPPDRAPGPVAGGGTGDSVVRCVVQHPGALCCTTVTTSFDDVSGTATVTVQTSARQAPADMHAAARRPRLWGCAGEP